jgi:hypothetical protein
MTDTKYNGWANYATWRVNLEIFDGVPFIEDFEGSTYDLSIYLKEYVEDYLIQDTKTGLAIDYALAFISDVNWYEIAESMESMKEEEIAA